ncbi:hypothetical protein [endosymbiont GvMRE of Glomus versiforme]|uniref:hypothetical protein n=1 Tax=endosymbiont GvMRE of Glomus versiforme TaxID=2039283 RepID=UPI000EE5337E|nr:hypothetical protein [endosymbiont GvMRE of Glomus versiforme]RHZ35236.1 hypothetical protein GvMRE_IIg299 [endosymbiont GvMRE of Glomus versiforme]
MKHQFYETINKQFERFFDTFQELKIEITDLKNQIEAVKEDSKSVASIPNSKPEISLSPDVESRMAALEEMIKHLRTGDTQFNLQKDDNLLEYMFVKSELKVDRKSNPPTADLLNKLLIGPIGKHVFADKMIKLPKGYAEYSFGARTLNDDYTPKEWITGKTSQIYAKDKSGNKIASSHYDNMFDTNKPVEKRVMLGTGAGKSTFFLRCVAHGGKENQGKGATLVVPYSSLIGSVLDGHRKWLSLGKDVVIDQSGKTVPDLQKRVTKCPICDGFHTAKFKEDGITPDIDPETKKQIGKYEIATYEDIHDKRDALISVFTWWEFLDIWVNDKKYKDGTSLIKPWVIFDEAHTDLPCDRILIDKLKPKEKKKMRPNFDIIEMSATFGDIPTSRRLAGDITDYLISDFNNVLRDHPEIVKKKIIIFIDKPNKDSWETFLPGLKSLEKKCKVLILNDAIKDYATDIVSSMKAPLIVIASRDYSVGFSFGDVVVISTGISKRTIRTGEVGKWTKEERSGVSSFDDLLQERGRACRNKNFTSFWLSFVPTEKMVTYNLLVKADTSALKLAEEINKGKIEESLKKLAAKLFEHYNKPEPLPPIAPEDGERYLNLILVNFLRERLDPTKLFGSPSNKKKDELGKVIFCNKLVEFFDKNQVSDILIAATEEKIKSIAEQCEWWTDNCLDSSDAILEGDDDCRHIYNNEQDAKTVGFLLQARIEGKGYKLEVENAKIKTGTEPGEKEVPNKLIFTFNRYKFDKKKLTE